ncbi:MAG: sulfurtransferase TusA family protein, partial [Planctomycetota bacterium]
VTTRQDIQIHEVAIEDTPDALEGLLEVGLSARGGGGNTVRNVTACPRAGVCPKEEFDVAPYAIAAAEYLLQFKSSYNLPRKYKIVFSGCSDDCAFASVADLAFFAHCQNGVKGFAAYAGGGLGQNPEVGVKIEEFVPGDEIFEVAEAIKRFFDKHGDRTNKHQARLRYVLKRMGEQEFVKEYSRERSEVGSKVLEGQTPQVRDIASRFDGSGTVSDTDRDLPLLRQNVLPERTQGLFTIRAALHLGDVPADDLVSLGRIADKFGQGLVRTTQLQDILITSVAGRNVDNALDALKELSIDVLGNGSPKIVACTGAATCKFGLCLSRNLADALSKTFHQNNVTAQNADLAVRISGCPNSCGHHHIAEIGLQGRAKRVNGKLMPCYDVLIGAKTVEGNARLAERIGTVPAKRIPDLLAETLSGQAIKTLIAKYDDIGVEVPDDYYYDWGSDEAFSLAGRGPGECGAGVMDVIKLDIDEAKEATEAASKQTGAGRSENLYKAIVAAARALLVTFGSEPKKDREIFAAFGEHLIEPGWVRPQTKELLDSAIDWRMGDRPAIDDLTPQVEELIQRVQELFLSLDANLNFRVEPFGQENNANVQDAAMHTTDLRGVACPLNFVKAKLALEKIEVGEILEVLLDAGEPVRNVPASFSDQGQDVLEVKDTGDHSCVRVRRIK